ERAAVIMIVFMRRAVLVMPMGVFMMLVFKEVMMVFRDTMGMSMRMSVAARIALLVLLVSHVNLEFHARYGRLLATGNVQMITIQRQLSQLALQPLSIDPKVDKRAEKHVAADAAEDVKVKGSHMNLLQGCLVTSLHSGISATKPPWNPCDIATL